jgi:hypothetical protein
MNRLTSEQRAKVVSCPIEGNSIRSTVRITSVAKKTVLRLVLELGIFCADYQDRVFRNLKCEEMQVDECRSFVYAKAVSDLVAAWEVEERRDKIAA